MNDKKPKEHRRLIAIDLVNAMVFCGMSHTSLSLLQKRCDSIEPARLDPDGSAVVIDKGQRADGLLVRRLYRDTAANNDSVRQKFIPWANIISVEYGE